MKKLKYQGGATRALCVRKAQWEQQQFLRNLRPATLRLPHAPHVGSELFSFSGTSGFADQLMSLYSFVYYVGVPDRWTVYSDGTYQETHRQCLTEAFPFVDVKDWTAHKLDTPSAALAALHQITPIARKLEVILGELTHRTVGQRLIYLDSDVVFYQHMRDYFRHAALQQGLWYVPDAIGHLSTYLPEGGPAAHRLNSGFLVFGGAFDTSHLWQYLEQTDHLHYFTEQLAFEHAFQAQAAQLLDPRQFIIDTGDQFDFSYKHLPQRIALRHYTSPVRHKMWQRGWKWHFQQE